MKNLSILCLVAILGCAYFLPNYHVHVQEGWGLNASAGNNKSIFNIIFMTILVFGVLSNYAKKDLSNVAGLSLGIIIISVIDIIFNFIGFTIETSKILTNSGFGTVDKTMPGAYLILILSVINFALVTKQSKNIAQ
jgi:hypothetical protein